MNDLFQDPAPYPGKSFLRIHLWEAYWTPAVAKSKDTKKGAYKHFMAKGHTRYCGLASGPREWKMNSKWQT
jgi:hypothetical protein